MYFSGGSEYLHKYTKQYIFMLNLDMIIRYLVKISLSEAFFDVLLEKTNEFSLFLNLKI